LFKENIH